MGFHTVDPSYILKVKEHFFCSIQLGIDRSLSHIMKNIFLLYNEKALFCSYEQVLTDSILEEKGIGQTPTSQNHFFERGLGGSIIEMGFDWC